MKNINLILVITIIIALVSCQKDTPPKDPDIVPPVDSTVNTKIRKLALLSSDERDTTFVRPQYDENGKLYALNESTLTVGGRTHILEFQNNVLKYYPADDNRLYNEIKFKHSDGLLDSIVYDVFKYYPNTLHIMRRIYKYDTDGHLKYQIIKDHNGKLDTVVKNFEYTNGRLSSYAYGDSVQYYEKVDIEYDLSHDYDAEYVNAINNYSLGYLGYNLLFFSHYYYLPLFLNNFSVVGMKENKYLIKSTRLQGFYTDVNGNKVEFDSYGESNYIKDEKGRITELPWNGPYGDVSKILIYYYD